MADTLAEEEKPQTPKIPEDPGTPEKKEKPWKRWRRRPKRRRMLIFLILALLLIGGYFMWRYLESYESTDDAQVDGYIHAISPRINGHVSQVLVEDEQVVKAGEVLVRIDPRDYEVAVARAEAAVADAEATLKSARQNVPITSITTFSTLQSALSGLADSQAALRAAEWSYESSVARKKVAEAQVLEAEAIYKRDADNVVRYGFLVRREEISQQRYDTAVQTAAADKAVIAARMAAVDEAQQNITAAAEAIQQARARVKQSEATVRSAQTAPQQVKVTQYQAQAAEARLAQAKANLAQAKLNLSYTTIYAPASGVISKKSVTVGNNVSPGQQLMALTQLTDVWVVANFKETQLKRMRPGQKARFSVDAYGRDYRGYVVGIAGASGSRLSLLPPENATGNYVKVVQRFPVRINLNRGENRDLRLRPGMSVEPKVYLR